MYKHIDTITNEKVQPIVFILDGVNINITKVHNLVDILAQKNNGKIKCYVRFEVLDMFRYGKFGVFTGLALAAAATGVNTFKTNEEYKFQGLFPVVPNSPGYENCIKKNYFSAVKENLFEDLYYNGEDFYKTIDFDNLYGLGVLRSSPLHNVNLSYSEKEQYFPRKVQTAFKRQFGNLPLLSQNEVGLSFVLVSDKSHKLKGIDELKRIVPDAKFYGFGRYGKRNEDLTAFTGDISNVYGLGQVDALVQAILSNQIPKIKYVEPMSPSFDLPLLKGAKYDNE